ncbi:TetR family transcriptional regulator [Haloactinopolyspora alba]|uniref:TetR family transcriptional regulator n=1 Tax=Haloactinopolyspora alba TaxID=648780 RepID=A0A2P8E522_9ACTN|nr:TetR/AcrR family transcriptional regulator [Haloactinopolyspora alba]PSL04561.1 TetR family transcriptional regulator [Haloactinopolyspora alba]
MDPRRRRTTDVLIAAAEEIFGERAVDTVTVGEIARRAGVAVGSIYNLFGSKTGLYASVVERALDADLMYMDRAYTDDRGPVEQIRAAADQYATFYVDHPEYFRMLAFPADPGTYPAGREVADRLARRVDQQNSRLADALRRGMDAGDLVAGDPEELATALWASWNGVISLGWRPDGLRRTEAELRSLLRTMTEALTHGLVPRAG